MRPDKTPYKIAFQKMLAAIIPIIKPDKPEATKWPSLYLYSRGSSEIKSRKSGSILCS